jgi:hypothetical protein
MFNFEAIAFADTAYTPIEELTRSDVTLNPQPSTLNPPLTPVGKDDFRGGGEGQTGCGNLGWHDFSLTTCGRIVQTLSGGVCPQPLGAPKRSGWGSTTSQAPILTAPFVMRSDRNGRVDNSLRLFHNSPMRSPNPDGLPVLRETSGQTYC